MKAFIAATLKAVDYSIAHPQEAVEISKADVPGLDDPTNAADALTVLKATLPLWETGQGGLQRSGGLEIHGRLHAGAGATHKQRRRCDQSLQQRLPAVADT